MHDLTHDISPPVEERLSNMFQAEHRTTSARKKEKGRLAYVQISSKIHIIGLKPVSDRP